MHAALRSFITTRIHPYQTPVSTHHASHCCEVQKMIDCDSIESGNCNVFWLDRRPLNITEKIDHLMKNLKQNNELG